jgi:hypothetical protein
MRYSTPRMNEKEIFVGSTSCFFMNRMNHFIEELCIPLEREREVVLSQCFDKTKNLVIKELRILYD